jgi:flagellar biosynthesis GTPase FlhF
VVEVYKEAAKEREAKEREAKEREAKEREAKERETKENKAKDRKAKKLKAKTRKEKKLEAKKVKIKELKAKERDANAIKAKERRNKKRQAKASQRDTSGKKVFISYDEKPGIQAIANITPDLPPTAEHGFICRDYEYRRLGTVSLLGGLDLVTGEIIPLIRDSHESSNFIDFLKMLDTKYSDASVIKIV